MKHFKESIARNIRSDATEVENFMFLSQEIKDKQAKLIEDVRKKLLDPSESDNECLKLIKFFEEAMAIVKIDGEEKTENEKKDYKQIRDEINEMLRNEASNFQKIATHEIKVPVKNMHLISHYAYLEAPNILTILFETMINNNCSLAFELDSDNNSFFDSLMSTENKVLIELVLGYLIKIRPDFERIKGTNMNHIIKMIKLGV